MKFKSRTNIFTLCLAYIVTIGLLYLCYTIYDNDNGFTGGSLVAYLLVGAVIWMMLSMAHNTVYEIKYGNIYYRSGFVRGKIKVDEIREIIKNKTMYVGLKPAAATNGLIIKYNKFDEIYFSPNTNDSFTNALLDIKKDIVVTQ